MKLIANITNEDFSIHTNQGYDFASDGGGGLFCEKLKLGLTDPCLALFMFRHENAPAISSDSTNRADELYWLYCDAAEEDQVADTFLGMKFKVLCWNPIPGEFRKNEIYEVSIEDEFGCGTDGFVSLDGYNVDTVEEAINHFVLVE